MAHPSHNRRTSNAAVPFGLQIQYTTIRLQNGFVHFECETGIQTLLPLIRQAKGRVVTITSGLGTFIYNRGHLFYTFSGLILGIKLRTIVNRSKDNFFSQNLWNISAHFNFKESKRIANMTKNLLSKESKLVQKQSEFNADFGSLIWLQTNAAKNSFMQRMCTFSVFPVTAPFPKIFSL